MIFWNLLRSDVSNGILRYWYRYAIVLVFFATASVAFWSVSEANGVAPESLTFGDYLTNAFAGMKEYVFNPGNPFNFPALWMFVFLTTAYITLNYPYQDLMGAGKHELVQAGSRSLWWYSKCSWAVLSVFCFYAAAASGIACVLWVSGGVFNISVSPEMPSALDFGPDAFEGPWNIAPLLALVPAMTLALCLLQLLLSLAVKPVPSFICTASLLFFSAFFKRPFLPGNYLMAARSDIFIVFGMSFAEGAAFAFALALFSVLCGARLFRTMDILEKE